MYRLIGLILSMMLLASSAWSAPTTVQSQIGKQDIRYWDGHKASFTRRTRTGGSLSLTPVDVTGAVDMLYAYGGGTARTVTTLKTACQTIGNTDSVVLFVAPGNWTITEDYTVPSNIRLMFPHGGYFTISSGKTLTMGSPYNVIAGRTQAFAGAGAVAFTNPGTVYAEWWGLDNTGTSDTYSQLAAAVASIPVSSTLAFGPGTFLLDDELEILKGISITCQPGQATTLKAGSNMTDKSMIMYQADQPDTELRRVENCKLDGDSIAKNGIELKQAYGLTFQDVTAKNFLWAGFLMNGDSTIETPGYGGYVYNINFNNCASNSNRFGYHLWKNKNHNAFTQFNFFGSGAYSCTEAGLWVHGDNATTKPDGPAALTGTATSGLAANWYGGQIEYISDGGASVKATNGAMLNMYDCYIEPASGGIGFALDARAYVELVGGHGPYYNSTFGDNSTMCFSGAITSVAYRISSNIPLERQCIGDRISDRLSYGPSNWGDDPYSGGYWWWKGMTQVDSSGNKWMSLGERGKAGEAGKLRFTPKEGRIIRPFNYEDLNENFLLAYWNEGDFVVTSVDLVITEAFVVDGYVSTTCADVSAHEGLSVGTTTYQSKFISDAQADVANLTENAVIKSWNNAHGDSVLGYDKSYFMPGVAWSDRSTGWDTTYDKSYIYIYSCPKGTGSGAVGTWSAGAGYIVITGYPLEYN